MTKFLLLAHWSWKVEMAKKRDKNNLPNTIYYYFMFKQQYHKSFENQLQGLQFAILHNRYHSNLYNSGICVYKIFKLSHIKFKYLK